MTTQREYLDFAGRVGLAAKSVSTTYTHVGVTLDIELFGPGSPNGLPLNIPLDIATDGSGHVGLADILLAIQTVCFVAELPLDDLPQGDTPTQADHRKMLSFQKRVKDALGNDAYDEFMTRLGHVEGWAMGRDMGTGGWRT